MTSTRKLLKLNLIRLSFFFEFCVDPTLYLWKKKPTVKILNLPPVKKKKSTRENLSNSARENSGLPVKIFKKVGCKVKIPPVEKTKKRAKKRTPIWTDGGGVVPFIKLKCACCKTN